MLCYCFGTVSVSVYSSCPSLVNITNLVKNPITVLSWRIFPLKYWGDVLVHSKVTQFNVWLGGIVFVITFINLWKCEFHGLTVLLFYGYFLVITPRTAAGDSGLCWEGKIKKFNSRKERLPRLTYTWETLLKFRVSKIFKYVNFRRVSKVAPWRRNNLFKIYFERWYYIKVSGSYVFDIYSQPVYFWMLLTTYVMSSLSNTVCHILLKHSLPILRYCFRQISLTITIAWLTISIIQHLIWRCSEACLPYQRKLSPCGSARIMS